MNFGSYIYTGKEVLLVTYSIIKFNQIRTTADIHILRLPSGLTVDLGIGLAVMVRQGDQIWQGDSLGI